MNPSFCKHRHSGFTLVELLVVIVIVATLATLTMMITGNIRKSANKTITIGNMRQIGVAMLAYNTEHGHYPDQNSSAATPPWDRLMSPFLGYAEPLPTGPLRPSNIPQLAEIAKTFTTPEDKIDRAADTYKRSFTMPSWSANFQLPGSKTPPYFPNLPAKKGIPCAAVSGPSRAAILCQWYVVTNVVGSGDNAYGGRGAPPELLKPYQQVLFADGHVDQVNAMMDPDEFKDKYWPKPS